jgi:hypothetical protein
VVATQNFQRTCSLCLSARVDAILRHFFRSLLEIHNYIKFKLKFITGRIFTYLVVISDKHTSWFRPLLVQCMYFSVAGYNCVCELNKSMVILSSVN